MLFSVPSAFATPLADKRAEAERIKEQVEKLDRDLEIAAESYNEAQGAYDAVTAKVAENEARAV